MEILIYSALGYGSLIFIVISILAHSVYQDDDTELNALGNDSEKDCLHLHLADIVEDACCTLETVSTYCLDCGEKLGERLDW